MDFKQFCYCVVRVAATGSGTTPINYKILGAYASEDAANEVMEALPETPKVRHYVEVVPVAPARSKKR